MIAPASQFISLWKSSSLIQGAMALSSVAAIIYLSITGQPIPDILAAIVMAIIGFYFGTKQRLA